MKLTSLRVYPIKSLGGIEIESAFIEPQGLQYDRRWMLIDPAERKFISQRQIAEMALLQVEIEKEGLKVSHKTKSIDPIHIPFDGVNGPQFPGIIWKDTVTVESLGEDIGKWFTEVLGRPAELVYMPHVEERQVKEKYAPMGSSVSLADRSPFLLIGEGSLADLNGRLDSPVPMDRFRANFIFDEGEAFVEDTWSQVRIGANSFHCGGPCGRCKVITIDQNSGIKGEEPFATLATYRRPEKSILFGQMLIWLSGTEVRVGDEVSPIA